MYFRKLTTKALAGNTSTFVYWGGPPIVKTSPAVLPDGTCVNVYKLSSIKLGFIVVFFFFSQFILPSIYGFPVNEHMEMPCHHRVREHNTLAKGMHCVETQC